MATNAVIFHHPDNVDTSRAKLMGRHAAGEGFLRGFVRHAGVNAFHAQTVAREHFEDFRQRVQAVDEHGRMCHWVAPGQVANDPAVRTLMLPGPSLGPFAWRRRALGAREYSLCGVNHTIASDTIMDGLGELLTTPVQPWDAVICTSNAVKATLLRLLDNWREFINQRTGGDVKAEVRLPVIPLGVDCDLYAETKERSSDRAALRQGLGIGDDDVAVLYFGRLSFHAKAHPLPMYLGLEEAGRRTGRRIHLIQAGWFANTSIEKEFRDGARAYCPSVNPIFLDGRDHEVRFRIWSAADLFTSFSDNIQETFGLTPIEAMAAGLPVVVSDWNGYRDTVRHGIEGFTVATWLPSAGEGVDLAMPPEAGLTPDGRDQTYNLYCGTVSQCTAVDIPAAIEAFTALVGDRTLRREMGEAGRRRSREVYDWRVVIGLYQDLWRELEGIRGQDREVAPLLPGAPPNPLRDDPFDLFRAYPTRVIDGASAVRLGNGVDLSRVSSVCRPTMNSFAASVMLDKEEVAEILNHLNDSGGSTVAEISRLFEAGRRPLVARTVAWLCKLGLVTLASIGEAGLPADDADTPTAVAGGGLEPEPPPSETGEADPPSPLSVLREPAVAAGADEVVTVASAPAAVEARSAVRPAGGAAEDVGPATEDLTTRAWAARVNGLTDEAERLLRTVLARNPDDRDANTQLGEILAGAGEWDRAIECFRTAIAQDSEFVAGHRNLGKALFLTDREAEGIHSFRRSVRLAPDDSESRYLLGAALRRSGAVNEAVQCLKICVELDPLRADGFYHLGLALKSLDRREEARLAVSEGLEREPANVYLLAASASIDAVETGRTRLTEAESAKRVALHMNRKFHYTILRPLFDVLLAEHWPLLTADGRELADFEPDVVLACDAQVRNLRSDTPDAVYVHVPHGLISKNHSLELARAADRVCATGPAHRESLIQGGVPEDNIWLTGYVQLDPLFRREFSPLPVTIAPDSRTVLFAPTYNPLMSSAPMLGERLVELIRGDRDDITVIIKPHPLTAEQGGPWMALWRRLAEADPHVHLVADPAADVVPYLQAADVLISDCSSVPFAFLVLDRPVVLISNPNRTRDKAHFDPDGIEWQWRGLGEELSDVSLLPEAVRQALERPELHAEQRARYRTRLFGDLTDGRAAERIAGHVTALST